MGSRKIDYIGNKFNKLTITKELPPKGKQRIVTCVCDCGSVKDYYLNNIRSGKTTSCGCHRSQAAREQMTTHGKKKHPNYRSWDGMIQRCYNENAPGYDTTGAMGIGVCEEWRNSIDAFIRDMGVRPSPKHSLMRIDKDKWYGKDNCIWSTSVEQILNRRKISGTTSKYKGVYFNSRAKKWEASIVIDGKQKFLGNFETEERAAQKYRNEFKKLRGTDVKYQAITINYKNKIVE